MSKKVFYTLKTVKLDKVTYPPKCTIECEEKVAKSLLGSKAITPNKPDEKLAKPIPKKDKDKDKDKKK